jgi:hypothetical protein
MMMTNEEQQTKNKRSKKKVKEEITTKEFLSNQRQELKNSTPTISQTTDKINDNVNDYQKMNKIIIEKSINSSNKNQQKNTDTINSVSNNYKESQENIVNYYQSESSNFINDNTKSYMTNYIVPQTFAKVYNKISQNVIDNTINYTIKGHELALTSLENFNKSIEIIENYHNDPIQNYFNFINKIREFYYT